MSNRIYKNPLISIVIATYNAGRWIDKTISSIVNQTYSNYEIIIVDGKSSDDTDFYISKHRSSISVYISEPDRGIFDAWNKGIENTKGDWICFLGAGDEFLPNALELYVNQILSSPDETEFISSKIHIVDEHDNILMTNGSRWEWPKFLKFMNTPHVGSFHSRKFIDKYGQFNISYKVAGDYEFIMRAKNTLQAEYIDNVTVKMLFGGISIAALKNMHEGYRVKTETGGMPIWEAKIDYYVSIVKANIRSFLFKRGIFLNLRK